LVLVVSDAGEPAKREVAAQAARPAALDRERAALMPELVDRLAEIVDRLDPLVVEHEARGGPAGVEREERPARGDRYAVAVARVREHDVEPRAAAAHVRIRIAEVRFVPIDVRRIRNREPFAGA